jgi:hypothetical protein
VVGGGGGGPPRRGAAHGACPGRPVPVRGHRLRPEILPRDRLPSAPSLPTPLSLSLRVSPSFWLHLCYMKFVMPSCLQLFGKSPHAKLSSLSTIVHRSQLTRFAAAFVDRELKCTVFTYWNNPSWGCFLRSFKRPEEWDSALKRRLSSTSGYSLPTHHQSGRQLLNFFGGFVSILFSFFVSTLPCSHHVYLYWVLSEKCIVF